MKSRRVYFIWNCDKSGMTLAIYNIMAIWIGLRRLCITDMTKRTGIEFWIFNRRIYSRMKIDNAIT